MVAERYLVNARSPDSCVCIRSVAPELLYVIEQMPGYIRAQDQTDLLLREGYWASYNRPFYPEIFNISGHDKLVKKYGDL